MDKLAPWIVVAVTLAGSTLSAQDIAGTWQGAITAYGTVVRQILKE